MRPLLSYVDMVRYWQRSIPVQTSLPLTLSSAYARTHAQTTILLPYSRRTDCFILILSRVFTIYCKEYIYFISIFYVFQYVSIRASLVSFIKHNDANQASRSSYTQHQVGLLSWSEMCIVGIVLECYTTLDSRILTIAEHKGNIIYIDNKNYFLQ